VRLGKFGEKYRRMLPVRRPARTGEWWCDWGAGVLELWRGLRSGRPHPTGAAHAAHVVDVMHAVHRSIQENRAIDLSSTFPAPEPLEWAR
jgi:hypothetical protein